MSKEGTDFAASDITDAVKTDCFQPYQDITPDDCEGKSQLNIEQVDVYVYIILCTCVLRNE